MNLRALRHPSRLYRYYERAAFYSLNSDPSSKRMWEEIYKPQLCIFGRMFVWWLRRRKA